MFFNIGPNRLDNFPVHYQHNNLIINLDSGWNESIDEFNNKIFYKGYLDSGTIEDYLINISNQEEPLYTGNFCLIKCYDQGVTIKSDRYRSFPIWYDPLKGITNLIPLKETCWTDSFVTILDSLQKMESKFDLLGAVTMTPRPKQEVVDCVDQILTNKISMFSRNLTQPIKVFLSGGIDTTTLFSYIIKLNIPYELVDCLHTDLDYFYLRNHSDLSNFWGYKQFHYWKHTSVLLSGTPGDEFTVRSPTTANLMLRYHNTSINDLMNIYSDSLHCKYFARYAQIFESQKSMHFANLDHVVRECLNIILNDWQHWHLGPTISYTPLRDIEIFKQIASLERTDLIDQIMDSSIQKELISRNAPELLEILSTNKNTGNYFENLTKILC